MARHDTVRRLAQAPSRVEMMIVGAGMVLTSVLAMIALLQ